MLLADVAEEAAARASGGAAPRIGTPTPRRARPDARTRALDGALACVARFGVSKTTVDDVARRAGLSRATLYRLFPGGRNELLAAMAQREIARALAALATRLDQAPSLRDRLLITLVVSSELICGHEALATAVSEDAGSVLPYLSFSGLDKVLAVSAAFLAPQLTGELSNPDASRVGEWVGRLVLSHVVCPAGPGRDICGETASRSPGGRGPSAWGMGLGDEGLSEERAAFLVDQFLLPGIDLLKSESSAPGRRPRPKGSRRS
ncbi:MAG: TetR/AcrR family transcriptional regulator, partial [Acidimicrobiales bacterium]